MPTAVYGIGNILLGDDGIGPVVANHLAERYTFDDDTVVEDLGTPSLDLPDYMIDRDLVVFIDAVASSDVPGTIRVFPREELTAAPPGIRVSPHEPSVNDALAVLEFAGRTPADVVLVGVVPQTLDGGVQLSQPVHSAVARAADAVIAELAKRGHTVVPK